MNIKLNFCRIYFVSVMIFAFTGTKLYAENNGKSAENLVERLYNLVTFDKGTTPDWNKVKSLFLDEAVIVLKTSRTENKIFNLDGFVGDFVKFIEESNVKQTGFSETIIKKQGKVFGDIA
ncbi:MAG: hypothetical protein ABFS16_11865 [Bacteroidota bacterium]